MTQEQTSSKILVIKLSALGDFIQALGPMAAIRKKHPEAHITLLTTKFFKGFVQKSGYFDEIWVDERPRMFDISAWIALRKKLNQGGFNRVYDLQNNDRTSFYFRLFSKARKPEWVGVAKGASHRNNSPDRTKGYAYDGHVQTLGLAGIDDVEIDRLEWMSEDISAFALKPPYVLIVPGCAPTHPQKRWPPLKYSQAIAILEERGFQSVLIGTKDDEIVTREIAENCPNVLNLTSKTSLPQIATLAQGAAAAIGNDTGPMHLIGATGCPCISLFSSHSNPVKHAPNGAHVQTLQRDELKDLNVEDVMALFQPRDRPQP